MDKSLIVFSFLWLLFVTVGGVEAKNDLEHLFDGQTDIKEPFKLRDPFKAPFVAKKSKSPIKSKVANGVFSNIKSIGQVSLDDISIIGVVIAKERRAIAKVVGQAKQTYVLKEGMKLGNNGGILRAIHPGGIVVVEKIINIYGQEEYLETVIPISQ